jgi:hypothetical protein
MRIIVTSDTHYQPQYRKVLEYLMIEIAVYKPDCVVLAGDVGEQLAGYEGMLKLLQQLDCPRLVLTGNHDLWAREQFDSKTLWTQALPDLTRQYGAIWLEGENWLCDGLAVCGTNGWYDYTGRDPSFGLTDEQYFATKDQHMADGWMIEWDWTDIEFATMLGDAFSARLASLDSDLSVREILAVTHVPAFAETIVRKPLSPGWNIGNAYFYNLTLGKRIVASSKVTCVISGHTHVGVTTQVTGAAGPVPVYVLPADYGLPAYAIVDYEPGVPLTVQIVSTAKQPR